MKQLIEELNALVKVNVPESGRMLKMKKVEEKEVPEFIKNIVTNE